MHSPHSGVVDALLVTAHPRCSQCHYQVSRADADSWHIQLKAVRDVPGEDLQLIVKDSGPLKIRSGL